MTMNTTAVQGKPTLRFSAQLETTTFKPYVVPQELEPEREKMAIHIASCVQGSFGSKNVRLVVGFGSYWQNKRKVRNGSDIDFFVLLGEPPIVEQLRLFNLLLGRSTAQLGSGLPLSPKIFVGTFCDVARGQDNLPRVLTIHNPLLCPPVAIVGNRQDVLLGYVDPCTVYPVMKEALFSLTRHFYDSLLKYINMLEGTERLRILQKRCIQEFIRATLIADTFFQVFSTGANLLRLEKYLDKELCIERLTEAITLLQEVYAV